MNSIRSDAAIIIALGGPSKVAEILCIDKRGGAQRVHNWLTRGIPSHVKVKYPHIFMPELAQAPVNIAQEATQSVAIGA